MATSSRKHTRLQSLSQTAPRHYIQTLGKRQLGRKTTVWGKSYMPGAAPVGSIYSEESKSLVSGQVLAALCSKDSSSMTCPLVLYLRL